MKIAYWDSGLHWDDPNLRWGSPSYLLEPGDPGYVPNVPANNETKNKQKHKKMKRNNYYPSRIADQIIWLTNFRNKLAGHASVLGQGGRKPAAVKAVATKRVPKARAAKV